MKRQIADSRLGRNVSGSEKGVGSARRPSTRRIGASGLRDKPRWRSLSLKSAAIWGVSDRRNMTQTLAEILLFVSVAINAALLIFIAGVLRKTMNDMDEPTFKHFVESLVRHSTKSPFMLTVLNIPAIERFHISISTVSVIGGSQQVLFSG
jgi:hypothetical protein